MRKRAVSVVTIALLASALPQALRACTPNQANATVSVFGGTDFDEGNSVAVDGFGNVYTTGTFYFTVDFDPGVGTANRTSVGEADVFVAKLTASGETTVTSIATPSIPPSGPSGPTTTVPPASTTTTTKPLPTISLVSTRDKKTSTLAVAAGSNLSARAIAAVLNMHLRAGSKTSL